MNAAVDLLAPGENVTIPGMGGMQTVSGTSISAAHVSGAAALLLQSNSSLSPLDAEYLFKSTGLPIPFNGSTYFRINVYNAIIGNTTSAPSNQSINESNTTGGNITYSSQGNSISVCTNLTSTNTVYNLTASVTYSAATIGGAACFNVTTSNVTLNCAGYSIIGTNATGTYGFWANASNATIKNCFISNFSSGISFLNAVNGTALNNSISGTYANGTGILINGSSNFANITADNITMGGNGTGIWIVNGPYYPAIDCQGKSIIGSNLSAASISWAAGINSTSNMTVIVNCNISNFPNGIVLRGANDSLVWNTNITTNQPVGSGSFGIRNTGLGYRNNFTNVNMYIRNGTGMIFDTGGNITVNCTTQSTCLIAGAAGTSTTFSSNASYGIVVGISRVYIYNYNISNFTDDIRFQTGSNLSVVANNTLNVSWVGGNAIHIVGSRDNNNFTGNNIWMYNASAVVFDTAASLNTTVDCAGGGFMDGANFSANGYGLYVNAVAASFRLQNCSLVNYTQGIWISAGVDSVIANNNITSYSYNATALNGTRFSGNSYRINMTDNNILIANGTGILLDGTVQNISIKGTTICPYGNSTCTSTCAITGANSSTANSVTGNYGIFASSPAAGYT